MATPRPPRPAPAVALTPTLPGLEAPPAAPAAAKPRRAGSRPRPRAGADLAAGASFAAAAVVAVAADTGPLTYGIPGSLAAVAPGCRVVVPVGGRLEVGVLWRRLALDDAAAPLDIAPARLRPLAAVLDETPLWSAALCSALETLARYLHVQLGMMVRTALPGPLRRTGAPSDRAPELQVWKAEAVAGADWPPELRKPERRVLERLLALGPCETSALRRDVDPLSGRARAVAVPQAMLLSLQERGLLRLWQQRVLRDAWSAAAAQVTPDTAPVLGADQRRATDAIIAAVDERRYQGFLLRGVTGSGKTEVYLHAIAAATQAGRGAVVLVPEIALTPQLVGRFCARFGERVIALHSGLSDGARLDAFERLRRAPASIVVGPRSALFAPIADIGVIVLDECHDGSFKQAAGVRYHARDLALLLGRAHGAAVVLGSATPSVEDWQLAQSGRLERLELPGRALDRARPEAWLIDLREAERLRDPDDPSRPSLLTKPLVEAVAETVATGKQAILLHNRRGFATTLVCRGCGASLDCPRCATTLVLHRKIGRLRCHLCDFAAPAELPCAHCGGSARVLAGAGTERIEHTLALALPQVRLGRFDRDTAQGERLHDLLQRFASGALDVLIGTQMLAKGHDFPSVTLVGVLLAEAGLDLPDFRAGERTFQLLTQVAGRAGRGDSPGRVLVQTWRPEHPAIRAALAQDHDAFLADELPLRRRGGYPPFGHLALLETRHGEARVAEEALRGLIVALRAEGYEVRGPLPAGVARVREVYRMHALLRDDDRNRLHRCLQGLQQHARRGLPGGVTLLIDVDPVDFA